MTANKLVPLFFAISSAFVCLVIINLLVRAKEPGYGSEGYIPEDEMPTKIRKLLANADEPSKRIKVIGCLVPVIGQKSGAHLFLIDQIGKSIPEPAVEHSIELVSTNSGKPTIDGVIKDVLKVAAPKMRCACVEGALLRSKTAGSINKFRYFEIKRISDSEFTIIDDALDGNVGDFDDFHHHDRTEVAR